MHDFSPSTLHILTRCGITILGPVPHGYAVNDNGYAVNDNGCHRILTFHEILEAARRFMNLVQRAHAAFMQLWERLPEEEKHAFATPEGISA